MNITRDELRKLCPCVCCEGAGECEMVTGYGEAREGDWPEELTEIGECPACNGSGVSGELNMDTLEAIIASVQESTEQAITSAMEREYELAFGSEGDGIQGMIELVQSGRYRQTSNKPAGGEQ